MRIGSTPRSGHLWQARFYSCPADEGSLFTLLRYVEQNPVRAGIVGLPWKYPWSSAAVHVGETAESELVDVQAWHELIGNDDWRKFLQEAERPERLTEIRRRTTVGHPIGGVEFVRRLERKLGVSLKTRSVGRPGKKSPDDRLVGSRQAPKL